ncbi:pyridoxamine 5'-phosphate oxidase family protein [soil metagenome]
MAATPNLILKELLEDFGTAMLVTRNAEDELRARPMAIAEVEADGTLWFATDRHAGKIQELAADSRVVLTMQSSLKFISLSGTASTVEDRAKIKRLWKSIWSVWFPGGEDDPNLLLLRVTGHEGEYWDNSGISGLKYLIAAGKALLQGTQPDIENDPKIHGKVIL